MSRVCRVTSGAGSPDAEVKSNPPKICNCIKYVAAVEAQPSRDKLGTI